MKITRTKTKATKLQKAVSRAMESVEAEIEYRKMEVVDLLARRMKEQGVNKGELAKRMGVANSRVSMLLSGDSNLTIDSLVRAGRAVDADLVQTFVPRGQKGVWVERKPTVRSDRAGIVYQFQGKISSSADLGLAATSVAREDAEDAA